MQQEGDGAYDLLEPLSGDDANIQYSDFELEDPDEDDLHPAPRDVEGQEEDRPAEDPLEVSPSVVRGLTCASEGAV